jgi:hypothetical protein
MRTGREFCVVKEILDVDVAIKAHGDAIYNLKFLQQVVRPVSLWRLCSQLREMCYMYRGSAR